MNVLEKTGLQYFWNKIKTYIGTQISGFWKEGQVYKCGEGTVDLDIFNMRDPKIYFYSGSKKKACILGHFHSDVSLSKFSVIYQDDTANGERPFVIETVPYLGILLGTSPRTGVDYYTATDGNYSTFIGRGNVSVCAQQDLAGILTGKRVQLTSKGYRPVDKQGSIMIDDTWAKNNMKNIATCDTTMIDAKVIDIDYDHKIATVRMTVQDTEGQYFYVKAGGTVIGGSASSIVDGEYYANVVLQVPYDSSGNVSLWDKYAIVL